MINIPLSLICIFSLIKALPQKEAPHSLDASPQFDFSGAILFALSMGLVVFALMEVPQLGWQNPVFYISIALTVILMSLFIVIEKKVASPVLAIALLKRKTFLCSNLICFLAQGCALGMVFWVLWMQYSLGFSPIHAALYLLPAAMPYCVTSRISGSLVDKYGLHLPVRLGAILFLIGNAWILYGVIEKSHSNLVGGMLLFGCGWGLIVPGGVLGAMGSLSRREHGQGSGILNTMRQLGGAVGFAMMGMVVNSIDLSRIHHYISSVSDWSHLSSNSINHLLLAGYNHSLKIEPIKNIELLLSYLRASYDQAFIGGMLVSITFAVIILISSLFIDNRVEVACDR
ncbi:MFS transporter [Piscirickettsia litoralis]|uniref:Major facilitator superfamily (MFS) profile domain-containing protein n=1 Tax=Piscirickettsia litoralis TaxID=1891921 RepID=A0ABX3A8P0_9GAMM|nr:MFS transporter [Piscirickettsia litoralis]ODN43940.1 hypothetical protein BGC07_14920 [Piscirickettsia litoralis]